MCKATTIEAKPDEDVNRGNASHIEQRALAEPQIESEAGKEGMQLHGFGQTFSC